jgi:signal transduction histidine kinase
MPNPSLSIALRDPRRLAALGATELMDSAAEPVFDRLTEAAARALGVPTAVMTLVDDRRQFFKSAVGLQREVAEQRGTPLSHSFCQHVVHTGSALRVEDAREHPLVRENLAVRDLDVIAYLGMPLVAPGGEVIGSLCAIDAEPHAWSEGDAQRLGELAREVMTELARRGAETAQAAERAEGGPDERDARAPFDPRALVDSACEAIADEALRRGLQVSAWIDEAVPARLHGDAERLRQTLDHLLANAIAFTPAGRVDVRVRALSSRVLRVEVADTGVGIAAGDLQLVFHPFFQTSAGATLRPGAAGLGLPAARRMVELLGGELGVRSRPGDGSTFHFTARF